jgi:hypothetical protein
MAYKINQAAYNLIKTPILIEKITIMNMDKIYVKKV